MTLGEAREKIRCKVIYSTRPGEASEGVITEVRESLVLVRFEGNKFSHACRPEDLVLMRGSSAAEHILIGLREARIPVYGDVPGYRYCDGEPDLP